MSGAAFPQISGDKTLQNRKFTNTKEKPRESCSSEHFRKMSEGDKSQKEFSKCFIM